MADEGYLLDADSLVQLRADHEFLASITERVAGRRQILYPNGGGGGGTIGRALTAITPASSHLTGSSFDFVRYVIDRDVTPQTTPKTLKEETSGTPPVPKVTKGVNRYTTISGDVGAFVQMHRNNGELVLLTVEDECQD